MLSFTATNLINDTISISNCDNTVNIRTKNQPFTVDLEIVSYGATLLLNGAGSENRTRATRSEAWHSTTKLYPHIGGDVVVIYNFFGSFDN